jgi:tRNA 5-methylaminomethyl-2-thiouridine biosynthesis bifunctional protein
MAGIVPAEVAFAGDGTPFSPAYDDVYHSAHGALQQARHVFIGGNDLLGEHSRWQHREQFSILETGFGLGLNFLATWQAWREAGRPCRLHFVSVEKHPFRRDDLAHLLALYPELSTLAEELLRQWPPLTSGFHRLHFDDGQITLTLLFGDASILLPTLRATFDAIYLDGFAPAKNPDLWSPAVLAHLSRLSANPCTLATWSVVGELRRSLEALGWQCERRRGFAAKREMLVATRSAVPAAGRPSGRKRPEEAEPTFRPPKHAIVIGAGLAGCAISERLAARGWQVELIERGSTPAQHASGNPAGVVFPRLAKDDAIGARLSRACYLYALHRLNSLPGVRWQGCGVLQLARDAAHAELQQATIQNLGLPPEFVEYFESDEASRTIGQPMPIGGTWFPAGGWVSPASFSAQLLVAAGDRVRPHFATDIARKERIDDVWQVIDASGHVIASAPVLILANAWEANQLLTPPLPLTPVRGQISYLPPEHQASVKSVLCRNGYLTPPASGTVCFGASFDSSDTDLAPRIGDHAANLDRLAELLPEHPITIAPADLDGRVGLRTATPDRLPMAGAIPDTLAAHDTEPDLATLPRQAGLYGLLGLGARGIVWGPLAAELLACQLNCEPLPLEKELVDAIDPARFHLRALRRGKSGRASL